MKFVRLAFATASLLPISVLAANAQKSTPTPAIDASETDLTALRAKAERGNAVAQYNLGLAHLQGRQTPVNVIEAYAWLTLAAEGGSTGRALESLLDSLSPEQLAAGRRHLEALRASNPNLRTAAVPPAPKSNGATPIIGAPASPVRPAPSTPIIAIPPSTPAEPNLQDQLATVEQERRQLATELAGAWKEIEQLKAQLATRGGTKDELSTAQTLLRESKDALAKQANELAAARADATAAHNELAKAQSQLSALRETARQSDTTSTAASAKASDVLAALERERSAHAATQASLTQLKDQLNELTTARTTLERDAASRTASAERAQTAAADQLKKLTAESTELSRQITALNGELNSTRAELTKARQTIATLEEQSTTARNELAQAKSALESATSRALTATSRAEAGAKAETQLTALRTQLASLEKELENAKATSSRLATDKAAAETALRAANQKLSDASSELTTLKQRTQDNTRQAATQSEQKVAALQSELSDVKSRLATAERASATRDAELSKLRTAAAAVEARPTISSGELESAKRAAADAQQQLAAAQRELTTLRPQAEKAGELEARVRQLEAEKSSAVVARTEPTAPKDDARLADAEGKLAMALRSYTLLSQERDELRARVNDLAAQLANTKQALTSAETQARTVVDANAAGIAASAELETLRNRAAAAERAAETANADLARANQLLAALRPTPREPTRPTAPAGEPARTHTITAGETLSSIAQRYYGNPARWPEILAANRDVLPDERSFTAGRTLRIP